MMSTEESQINALPPTANSMAAFSDKLEPLSAALDVLYIPKNASGRNKFVEKWPLVSRYLFGETLIKYDHDGTDDWDHRAKLEAESDERRIILKRVLREVVDKSVDAGVLETEYVGKIIDDFGVELCTHIYHENIIERVRPGSIRKEEPLHKVAPAVPDPVSESVVATETVSDEKLSAEEKSILSNQDDATAH